MCRTKPRSPGNLGSPPPRERAHGSPARPPASRSLPRRLRPVPGRLSKHSSSCSGGLSQRRPRSGTLRPLPASVPTARPAWQMEASLAKDSGRSCLVSPLRAILLLPHFGDTLGQCLGETLRTLFPFILLYDSAPRALSSRLKTGLGDGQWLPRGRGSGVHAGLEPADLLTASAWVAFTGPQVPLPSPNPPSPGGLPRGAGMALPAARPLAAGRARPRERREPGAAGRGRDACVLPFWAEWASVAGPGWWPLPPCHLISASV